MRRRVSAPGNLLILGEYAVTEPGGLGLALGCDPRAFATSDPAQELAVTARFGTTRRQWPDQPLPVVEAALEILSDEGIEPEPQRLEIDTRPFYQKDRKLGFGSSAVASVLLTTLLVPSRFRRKEELFRLALRVHRALQAGRGSGYDVAASVWGGAIAFEGGLLPTALPVELPWLPRIYALLGAEAVRSGGAVDAYSRWKNRRAEEAAEFFRESNALVQRLLSARSWNEAAEVVEKSKRLGEKLGRNIGVESTFRLPRPKGEEPVLHCDHGPVVLKSVGAGAEMGILLTPCEMEETTFEAVELNDKEDGVRWE